jgi:MFS family permease
MIHGLLPVFLTGTLGASVAIVGLIEGAGEALAQIVKVFSGTLSDRIGRRKPLLLLGYGLAAATKPAFALAGSAGTVLGARLADRLGKGIRGAPRDALIADLVPEGRRGAAYGLRQSMDTFGAVLGPLAAIAIMALSGGNIRLVFALAILPAILAVAVILRWVRDVEGGAGPVAKAKGARFGREQLAALGPGYWRATALGALISFARISEAFLILRLTGAGLDATLAPLGLIVLSAVYTVFAWPLGHLADQIGGGRLLFASTVVLAAAHLVLALAGGVWAVGAGITLWGLHMALSQGQLSTLIAANISPDQRGTGFGVFGLVTGVVLIAANALAGLIWTAWGPAFTFAMGAGAALLAGALAARRLREGDLT